jgi:hypothetical protein
VFDLTVIMGCRLGRKQGVFDLTVIMEGPS